MPRPRRAPRSLYAVAASLVVAAGVFSCSLLVERRGEQCQTDTDCAQFAGAACDPGTHACVDKSQLACQKGDCVCNPTTPNDILNACPKGACTPFDDGRVKLADGGLPPLPDGGAAGAGGGYTCPGGTGGSTSGTGGTGGAPPVKVCETLPSPLYIIGPGTVQPLLGWVAKLFATQHVTVVFQNDSSCVGVAKAFDPGYMENDPGNEAWTTYYDAAGVEHPCAISGAKISPDIGLSDVFPQTCGYNVNNIDPTVVDTPGPVQAMGFIVPNGSKQTSISAAAAYMVFGFGDASGVTPWTDQKYIFQRGKSSGTQNMIAKALGLDPTQFAATKTADSESEAALVGCSPEPEKTIGVLAVDLAESKKYPIRLLSYQHFHQTCGYLPDSTETANDKREVRDGHYFIWGPIHMLTRSDHTNDNAAKMIKYVGGIIPPPANVEVDLFKIWADAHLVPQCAMRVTRSSDGGPLAAYHPPASCYCKYDEVTDGSAECTKCQTAADCPAGKPSCSYGYCEGQ
jgi:hypothetical protein